MKFVDIDKKFTEKVAEYIAKGYIISSQTMSGHQGEIGKVDLFKGTELIRVLMDKSWDWKDPDGFYKDRVHLKVGKWNREFNPERAGTDTVWNNDIEVFEEITYYQIDRNWYLDNKEEAIKIIHISNSRDRRHPYYYGDPTKEITSDRTREIAARYLRRVVKYKRLNMDNIQVFKCSNNNSKYKIRYNGNNYNLK